MVSRLARDSWQHRHACTHARTHTHTHPRTHAPTHAHTHAHMCGWYTGVPDKDGNERAHRVCGTHASAHMHAHAHGACVRSCVHVRIRACAHAHVGVCAWVCACACVWCVHVHTSRQLGNDPFAAAAAADSIALPPIIIVHECRLYRAQTMG